MGVTAKTTGDAALETRRLRKKSDRFRDRLEKYLQDPSAPRKEIVKKIANRLEIQSDLWKDKLIDNGEFADVVKNLINEFATEIES